jgi:SAM-dependent methyltransferase/mannose-6-phosphate isomerase-like protein (cupin superfamily)
MTDALAATTCRVVRLARAAADSLRAGFSFDAITGLEAALCDDKRRSQPWMDPLGLACEAPETLPTLTRGTALLDAANALLENSDGLPWKQPKDLSASYRSWASGNLRSAMLIGAERYGALLLSDKIYAGVFHLTPHTSYPCHAHEADEALIILSGASAEWRLDSGDATGTARRVFVGECLTIPSCTPHSVQTFDEPLLVFYIWSGRLSGRYWFCSHAPPRAPSHALLKTNLQGVEPEEYYDAMAPEYEETVRRWGYDAPEQTVERLLELMSGVCGDKEKWSLLDLGCGDGLVGEALRARRSAEWRVVGADVSSGMLCKAATRRYDAEGAAAGISRHAPALAANGRAAKKARKRSPLAASSASSTPVYEQLDKVDLSVAPYPYEDESYDVVLCVGTTTYLRASVLDEWLRVVRPGGLIGFTHKSAVWPLWEGHQQDLVSQGKWEAAGLSEDLSYLPGYDENARLNERVRVYFFRKLPSIGE